MANSWIVLSLSILLFCVRLYFALQPSYIHPDENFQGPEVIAGHIFPFPFSKTWEFTSPTPTRSAFPLWPLYGLPMVLLQRLCWGLDSYDPTPRAVYYTLRLVMFMLSVVLENWAIHELVPPRQRKVAGLLVASSYVTWTYQSHTFSNSVETLVVLWSLVLLQRIREKSRGRSLVASALLGFLAVFGIFNRITYPAFVLLPSLYLLPHFSRYPSSPLLILLSAGLTTLLAHTIDNAFYNPVADLRTLFTPSSLKLTPLASLLYNLSPANLSTHGSHPRYTHFLVNLPLLLGPALPFLRPTLAIFTALSATTILSLFSHQEPRFLLPCVPILLSSVRLPRRPSVRYPFLCLWLLFNALLGVLMGIYHQGGVVPMQMKLGALAQAGDLGGVKEIMWWRTYSPPVWLFGGQRSDLKGFNSSSSDLVADNSKPPTSDLMGMPFAKMKGLVEANLPQCGWKDTVMRMPEAIVLVAPYSSLELDAWQAEDVGGGVGTTAPMEEVKVRRAGVVPVDSVEQRRMQGWLRWGEIWTERRHLNLDDLGDGEGDDSGFKALVGRVVGRRGLKAWRVERVCMEDMQPKHGSKTKR